MAGTRRPRSKKATASAADGLRRQAEEHLDALFAPAAPTPEELAAAVHELRVHQIELEMQNEELRRAYLELEAQHEKYFELFDRAPVGYLALDDSGIVRDSNVTAARLLGIERQQLVRKPLSTFVFAADQDVYYRHLGLIRRSGWPQTCELRLHSVDAEPFWVSLEWRMQSAADGEPLRYQVTFTDVHERVLAEEALRESEEKYRTVADFTHDWEAWRAPDGTYRYVSPSCERISGHAAAEFLADPDLFVQIAHPDDLSKMIEHRHAADHEAQEQDLELEFRILTPSGETRWISHFCNAVYGEDGQWLGRRESNRDITARKLAEDALRVATARLSLATRAGGVGVWDWDLGSDVLTWDDQMLALYGITGEQFGGAYEAWRAGVHPDDRERGDAEAQMALRGEKELDTEFRVLWPDGSVRVIRGLALVQRDASGQATHMIGTNWDITAEKRAEEELRESEAQFRSVVERATDGIAILQDGLVVFVNEAVARMSGYAVEECEGQPVFALAEEQKHVEVAEDLSRRLAGEEAPSFYDLDLVRKDGTPFTVEVSAGVVTYQGAPADLVLLRDVTVRKQADEALRESESKYRGVVERATDGIAILQGDVAVFVNEAMARMSGYSVGELTGASFLVVVQEEQHAETAERVRRRIAGEDVPSGYELGLVRKDGTPFIVEVSAGVVTYEGAPAELVLLRDVTERKQAAQALRQSEALLRGILDSMQDAYVRTAGDGRFVMVSPSAARMYGYDSADEMIGLPAASLYADQADREAMFDELRRVGSVTDHIGVGRRKDGSTFSVSLNAQFYRDDAGNVLGSEGFVRDITERRKAEEALRESVANFSAFFEAVDDIIVVATPEGRFVHGNPALLAKLGYSAAELAGTHVLDLYPAQMRGEAEAIFAALLRGERESCSLPVQSKSGALVPVETRVWAGRWDGAECFFGVSKDLSSEQETLQKFERLFGGNPVLMALSSSPDGRFTDVNEAFLGALGYTREEVLGRTPGELGIFVEAEKQRAAAELLLAQGRIADVELTVRRKDGTFIDGRFSGEVMGSPGRQYLLTAMVDQAELKQARDALAESEKRLRSLFESMTEGVVLFAADGQIVSANPAAESILGLTRSEIQESAYDSPHWELRRPDGTPLPMEEMPGVRATREKRAVKNVVTGFTQADGATSWISVSAAPLLDAAGEVEGVVTSFSDITGRRRAEAALQESEQNFRALFETVDDVIVVGTPEGRLVYANPAASTRLGLSADELIGMQVLDLHPPDRRGEAAAIYAAVLKGEPASCPLPLLSKSGALVPVATRVWAGHWDGADCVFCVSKDLTTEQEALQKFERLFRGNPALMAVSSLPDGRFIDVNEAFLSTLGYSREEVLGHTDGELNLFVEPEKQQEIAEQLQALGRVSGREHRVKCKDGTILDGLFSGEIIEDQGRQYFLTVMIDQTERKRAEDRLRARGVD